MLLGGETPGSVISYKVPVSDAASKRSPRGDPEEQKMNELRRLRSEAKAAESVRKSQELLLWEDNGGKRDSHEQKTEVPMNDEPLGQQRSKALPLHRPQNLAQDSDHEGVLEEEDDLRRSIPGQPAV